MEVPRDRLHLEEDERLISPPFIVAPLYQCAIAVVVRGFLPQARLDVEMNGTIIVSGIAGGFPEPDGVVIHLPQQLLAGQKIRARQHYGGVASGWSPVVTVRNHHQDYPAGPPRPVIDPGPQFGCGARTGVNNLLTGCRVWITADGNSVGTVNGAAPHQGVNVAPAYNAGQHIVAYAELCNDPSPASAEQVAQVHGLPLAAPGFESVYAGSHQIVVTNLVDGVHFTVSRNGVAQGTWTTWGYKSSITLNSPVIAGETFSATQKLCPSDPPSPAGTTHSLPCSALPAPTVAPVQDGDTSITLLTFVVDARIKVFANGSKIGDGGGSIIQLSRAVNHGETIDVLQSVGNCVGQTVQEVRSQCVAPPVTYDPSARDLFPVGFTGYDGGTKTILGTTYHVKGTVYYPAEQDGSATPFNKRLGGLGPASIVFMAHGNHDPSSPSHLGYDYFQQQLASMGIIAASVFLNETNGFTGGVGNIRARAELVIASIAHFNTLSIGGDPIFGGHVDLSRVGLMGHSRGGDAVVLVPEIITLPGITLRGVIALAPTDFGASSGAPHGYAFMTILPAADGDVVFNDGAKFYDKAQPDPFRSQLYVDSANHNFFNRQWLNNDNGGGLPTMARVDHERTLSAYGCAFYQNVLLHLPALGFLEGKMLPSGVLTNNVHLGCELSNPLIVDNYLNHSSITINSLGGPVTLAGGAVADEYDFSQLGVHRYNTSFFGNAKGMVVSTREVGGVVVSELPQPKDLNHHEIWLRCAEVYSGGAVPAGVTGFQLGLRDTHGTTVWVDSDEAGGVPRPFDRHNRDPWTKTMLSTLRFKSHCFRVDGSRLDIDNIKAILFRLNRNDQRALAFDDIEFVKA